MDLAAKELFEAQAHVYRHLLSHANSMALGCALELGIPDILHRHAQPISIHQLVSDLNLPVAKTLHLQRLMRLLTHSNFFVITKILDQDDDHHDLEGYVLTTSSKLLLKTSESTPTIAIAARTEACIVNNTATSELPLKISVPAATSDIVAASGTSSVSNTTTASDQNFVPNLLPLVRLNLDPVMMTPWRFLGKWFRGSESTAFETAYGTTMWEFANENPRFNRLFNDAMASDSQMMSLVVKDCAEMFEGVKSLVDVGGGTGLIAKILVEAFPHMTCTVFDLPHVIAGMIDTKNLKYVAGDMFSCIPSADVIFFKNILHDWSDENVLKILKSCREGIRAEGDKGKVIIIEMVVDEKHDRHEITKTKMVCDILMMLFLTGRERTKVEWEKLFMEAGFSRCKITHNFGLRSTIELFPSIHSFIEVSNNLVFETFITLLLENKKHVRDTPDGMIDALKTGLQASLMP